MKLQVRYANHPEDSKHYTTEDLRRHYLMEKVFEADDILLVYSHQDRIISGGVMPVTKALPLETSDELRAAYFLERRELGIINIGGAGKVTLDGKVYNVKSNAGSGQKGLGTAFPAQCGRSRAHRPHDRRFRFSVRYFGDRPRHGHPDPVSVAAAGPPRSHGGTRPRERGLPAGHLSRQDDRRAAAVRRFPETGFGYAL